MNQSTINQEDKNDATSNSNVFMDTSFDVFLCIIAATSCLVQDIDQHAAPQRRSKRRRKDKKDEEESDSDDELNVGFNPNYDPHRKNQQFSQFQIALYLNQLIDGITPDAADENAVFCGDRQFCGSTQSGKPFPSFMNSEQFILF